MDAIKEIRKLKPVAGDVLVVRLAAPATAEQLLRIGEGVRRLVPEGVKALVMDQGMDASVLRGRAGCCLLGDDDSMQRPLSYYAPAAQASVGRGGKNRCQEGASRAARSNAYAP